MSALTRLIAASRIRMVEGDVVVARTLRDRIEAGVARLSGSGARSAAVTLVDQAVVSGTNFMTGVVIGRVCTKQEFGLYMLGLTILLYATSLQTSLILTPYMMNSPQLRGRAQALFTGSTLVHQVGLSALAVLCLTVAGAILSLGLGPQGLKPVVWTLAAVIAFILLRDYARQVCFSKLQVGSALLLDSAVAAGQLGCVLLLAHMGVLSSSLAYGVIGVACGLAALAWLIWMRAAFALSISQAMVDLRYSWAFGKWVFASGLLWTLSMSLYPWFLAVFHGTESAGVWAACVGIVAICNPLLIGATNFLGPRIAHSFAQGGRPALWRYAVRASLVFSVLVIPLCLILLVFGDSLMARLYGAKYAGNGSVVSVLAVDVLVSAAGFTFSRSLFAMGRARVEFMANLAALFVLLAAGIWLVKAWGPLGAACGILIADIAAQVPKALICAALTGSSRRRQTR